MRAVSSLRLGVSATASRNVPLAVQRARRSAPAAIIADFDALRGAAPGNRHTRTRALKLRRSIVAFRRLGPLPIIVSTGAGTSSRQHVVRHAAALRAGADLVLSWREVQNRLILRAHLRRLLEERRAPGRPAADRLRNSMGRLDAKRIAQAMGVPLVAVARVLGVKYGTLHKTPDAASVQGKLLPFARLVEARQSGAEEVTLAAAR